MTLSTTRSFLASSLRRRFLSKKPLSNTSNAGVVLNKRCYASSSTSTGAANDNSTNEKPFAMAQGPVNPFQMNQHVIACTATRQAAIVDCGATTPQELDAFLKWITDQNYTLTAVWQTHAHLDHVAGLGMLTSMPEYAEIPIYLHEKEVEIYNNFESRCLEMGFPVDDGNIPDEDRLTLFGDDTTFLTLGELTFDIIRTPGHSPGQVGFLEGTHTKSFIGGDFIMKGSIGRTDFPESSHEDMQASLESFAKTQDDETIIYPGHGPPTTLGQEKQTNPYLQPFV